MHYFKVWLAYSRVPNNRTLHSFLNNKSLALVNNIKLSFFASRMKYVHMLGAARLLDVPELVNFYSFEYHIKVQLWPLLAQKLKWHEFMAKKFK